MRKSIKLISFLCLMVALACYASACSPVRDMNKDKTIYLDDMVSCENLKSLFSDSLHYDIIPLEMDSLHIPTIGMKLFVYNDSFLLGDKQFTNMAYLYNSLGQLENTIGNRGNSGNEYPVFKDYVVLNDTVSVLSSSTPGDCLYNYNIKGNFLGKVEIPNIAVSIARNADGDYIVNSGRNVYNSKWQIIHYTSDWKVLEEYFKLSENENNVPVFESNFSVIDNRVYYHEAFNNQLYVLEDTLKTSYYLSYGDKDDFEDIRTGKFTEVVDRLYKKGFYLINSYAETDSIVCLLLNYLKENDQKQKILIFDKIKGNGRILEMSKGEMFIGNICIQDNMLYFLASDYFLKEYVSSDLQLDNDIFVLKIKL